MKILNFIVKYLKSNKLKCITYLLFSIFIWALTLILPYIFGAYIDTIIYKKSINFTLTAIIIILFPLKLIFTYFKDILLNYLSNNIALEIQSDSFNHIRKLPLSYLNTQDASYLTSKINNGAFEMVSFVLYGLVDFICSIVIIIIGLILILNINLTIGITFIITLPLYLILVVAFKKPLFSTSYKTKEAQNTFFATLNNQILNVKLIKINVWFDLVGNEIKKAFSPLTKAFMKNQKLNLLFSCLNDSLKNLSTILLLIIGGKAILDGNLTIGKFEVLNNYFNLLISALSTIINFTPQYQSCSVSYERLMEILNQPLENNGTKLIDNIYSIKLTNLTFGYLNNKNIINCFNYKFAKGKIYIIKGNNGKGKSTLINLLLGLYTNYTGEITYNDIDIKTANLYNARKNLISVTEQNFCLMNSTVKGNMLYGINEYNEDYLYELCSNFKFTEEFINKKVSNQSDTLSGGQKQKISLIRSLIKSKYSNLLVLDEPSSALDLESIRYLKQILLEQKNNKITIIITHDTQMLDIADEYINL